MALCPEIGLQHASQTTWLCHDAGCDPCAAAEVAALMQDECAAALTPASNMFWVLVAALRGFVEGEGGGDLPLEVRAGCSVC